jgi:hypothetical protein
MSAARITKGEKISGRFFVRARIARVSGAIESPIEFPRSRVIKKGVDEIPMTLKSANLARTPFPFIALIAGKRRETERAIRNRFLPKL